MRAGLLPPAGAAAALLAALAGAAAAAGGAVLELPDGRRIPGDRLRTEGDAVVLETSFGPLRVPRSLLGEPGRPGKAAAAVPAGRRTVRTRWFALEHDLAPEREALYRDELDAFVDWMLGVYGLDRDAMRKRAPFPLYVYRSRREFKEVQQRVAPGIESAKGQSFAEGVAGFHSRAGTYLWDVEGESGDVHLGVAKHEVTHLLNGLVSERTGIRFPVWFEEGSATYFMNAASLGGREPEDDAGTLAVVLGDLDGAKPYSQRELRSVPYGTFYGREYAWGWALVRFLRRDRDGARWKPFLEVQRTVGAGAPADPENRRFLKAVGFPDDAEFDRAWHGHLRALRAAGGASAGTSEASLREIEAMARPGPEQARTFARVGASLALKELDREAAVYLRAALRGGAGDAGSHRLLALAEARLRGLGEEDPWPADLLALLRRAVEMDPLRAAFRRELGARMLRGAAGPEAVAAARDQLGLALLLVGPDDDLEAVAAGLLAAVLRAEPRLPPAGGAAWIEKRVPDARDAAARAVAYLLQGEARWDELAAQLEGRVRAKAASHEERAMLAGLYRASDRLEEAAALYGALLEERPGALHLWPARIACLAGTGKAEDARRAREDALRAVDAAGTAGAWVREEILRIRIE